jgi:glutaredoxin
MATDTLKEHGRLKFYTTAGCHLCEHAEAILLDAGCNFSAIDIEHDPELIQRYGIRIPVVAKVSGAELGWPFDGTALRVWLAGD